MPRVLSRNNEKDSLTISEFLRRSPTCSSLLAVECTAMVFNALQINSYVFSEEVGENEKKKSVRSTKDQCTHWYLRSANSASITSLAIQWSSVRACNGWLPQCPSYSMNVVMHIGKQRLSKPRNCHQIITSSRTKRRPAVLSTVRKV